MIRLLLIAILFFAPFTAEAKKQKPSPFPPPVGKSFVLLTMPKTGTHLISPFLTELTNRRRRWASGLFRREFASCEEEEWHSLIQTPGKVPYFFHYRPIDTKLVINAVESLTKSDHYFACHTPYSEELDIALQRIDHLVIFLLRDPRDVAVSGAHFYGKRNSGGVWNDSALRKMNLNQKLMTMIRGLDWSNGLRQQVASYTPWRHSPNCCALRFEALVSPSQIIRLAELRKLADALDIEIDDEELLEKFQKGIGKGPTYFKGKSGAWKQEFTDEHLQAFEEELGDWMPALDY